MIVDRLSNSDIDAALTQFKLANAWQLRGDFDNAFTGYQETLQLRPGYLPAYQQLGNMMLRQHRIDEALEYYNLALAIDFETTDLSFYYQCLGWSRQPTTSTVKSEHLSFPSESSTTNSSGKIDFGKQRIFGFHRSGWNFAIQAISPLHNSQGILFDGCLEDRFLFQHNRAGQRSDQILAKMRADGVFQSLATSEEKGIVPYQQPWVGFLHNPQSMPVWFNYQKSPQKLFEKEIWQASLPHCLGLFSLSEYNAEWLRKQTGKTVSVLTHPTEIPDKQFDFDRFLANPQKKVVQIGWWLRKLHSIYQLPLAHNNSLGYEKIRIGFLFDSAEAVFTKFMKIESRIYKIKIDDAYLTNTSVIQHLPNDEYDDLLSMNIAFVDLYDSSANNAIIECIARATPLLVNPLPAVKEYLGEDYPMYFNTLAEAAAKALDTSLILETNQYLKSCKTRHKLSAEYFLDSFCNSKVYQSL
jgi:tetratricopeptide (TPR) repeat protein